MKFRRGVPCAVAVMLACGLAHANAMEPTADQWADMSLEQLGNIVITSVSRQEARLGAAPAALYIISASDIRRSGVHSLPEALRLAPNLQVSRIDARQYAVSARGFNTEMANKLLVLIDGRSIYSPLFSGVIWDLPDLVLSDIARIEVISGPGATIWGANAVNGIINIITKSAAETQGGLARLRGGEFEKVALARYGGPLGGNGHYRIYGKTVREDGRFAPAGHNTRNEYHRNLAGFRADWTGADGTYTLSSDVVQVKAKRYPTQGDIDAENFNVLGRYTGKLAGGELRLQAYYDHTGRNQRNTLFERLNTLDLEAQHGIALNPDHQLVWGAGYRHAWDRVRNPPNAGMLPPKRDLHWANVFIQDEMQVVEQVKLTAGLKAEHNVYTGWETLPNVRLAWTPDTSSLLWSSLSRAVRVPARIDRDYHLPGSPPVINGVPQYLLAGGPTFISETADVLELGYRAQPMPSLSWSATANVGRYDHLRTFEQVAARRFEWRNLGQGRSRGIEIWGRWQLMQRWRLDGGLALQRVRTSLRPGSTDRTFAGLKINDPGISWSLRSSHDLTDNMQLDLMLRHMGKLTNTAIPSYSELDVNFQWGVTPDIDLAITGLNLLHRRHVEIVAPFGNSQFERGVLFSATVRF